MKALILVGLLFASAAQAATVSATLNVSPLSVDKPTTVTVTWTASGAGKCIASGDWSGSKNVSGGSELVSVTKASSFSLACESPTGPVTINWTPPTKYSDGSTISALKNYVILSGPSAVALSRNTTAPADAVKTIFQAAPGLQFFAVRSTAAVNGIDTESMDSATVSKTVVADKATPTVNVAFEVKPLPPTNVTVE